MLLKIIIRLVLCFNFIYIPNKCFAKKRLELKELESKLNDAERYNKNLYPNEDLEIPTNIVIQMYIEGMSSFRAATMDFQVDIYFQQLWVDKRLKHSGSKRILIKDKHTFAMIWTPGLYFANAKEAAFHDVTDPNFLVWIYPNGTVFYDTRISLNVICMQNLSRYPHDTQSCKLRILSYAYDNNQLVIEWKDDSKAIDVNKDIRMIDMTLRTIRPSITNDSYASGVWSCARAEFIVDRELMHHLLQTYLPTSLIVVISWFSFWLDIDSVQAKVSLNITTLLALVTQNQAARMSLPHDSADVKAIDIWMGALMTFLFSGMIEFTLVNYYNRRTKRKREKSKNDYDACCGNSNVISNCRHNGLSKKYEDDISSKSSLFPRSHNCILRSQSSYIDNCLPGINSLRLDDVNTNGHALINDKLPWNNPPINCILSTYQHLDSTNIPSFKCISRRNYKSKVKNQISLSGIKKSLFSCSDHRHLAQKIDHKSRIYFPLLFFVFNVVYWFYYLLYDTGDIE